MRHKRKMNRPSPTLSMGLFALFSGLIASSAAAMSPQEPDLSLTQPHASLIAPYQPFNRQGDSGFGLDLDQYPWVVLKPTWVSEELDGFASNHQAFCQRVATSLNLSAEETALLIDATKPRPIMVEYQLSSQEGDLLLGRESILPGQPQCFRDTQQLIALRDFDVEIASGSGIADPVISRSHSGSSLALRVIPAGSYWLAEFALVSTDSVEGAAVPLNYSQLAGKQRLQTQLSEGGNTVLLEPGKTITMSLPFLVHGPLTLDLRVDAKPTRGEVALPGGLAALYVPWLEVSGPSPIDAESALRALAQNGLAWGDGNGLWLLSGPGAAESAVALASTGNTIHEAFQVDMILSNTLEGEAPPVALSMPVVAGKELRFAKGTIRDSLTDWDVEVAQVSRIADPHFEDFFGGVRGNLTAVRLADGRLQVQGDITVSIVNLGQPTTIRLASATAGEKGYDGEVPAAPAQVMGLEHPELSELRFAGTWEPDENGKITLVRSAKSLLGDGVRVRLEVQVSSL